MSPSSSLGKKAKRKQVFVSRKKTVLVFFLAGVGRFESLQPAHRLVLYSRQKGISFIPHVKTRAKCICRPLPQAHTVNRVLWKATQQRCAGLVIQ